MPLKYVYMYKHSLSLPQDSSNLTLLSSSTLQLCKYQRSTTNVPTFYHKQFYPLPQMFLPSTTNSSTLYHQCSYPLPHIIPSFINTTIPCPTTLRHRLLLWTTTSFLNDSSLFYGECSGNNNIFQNN